MKYFLLFVSIILLSSCKQSIPTNPVLKDQPVKILPDYSGITIPANIAPLNFMINKEADKYLTVVYSSAGNQKFVFKGQKICFKMNAWHNFIQKNKGDTIYYDFYLFENNVWNKYNTIKNAIADSEIDEYLSYRLIAPSYVSYEEMSINQRNLTNFKEKIIYDNQILTKGEDGQCINCHSYQNYNKTGNMQFHIRQRLGGTVIVKGNDIEKVNLKTPNTISVGVYPSWHPSKALIAYSVNSTSQNFHTKNNNKVEVMDSKSDLILYNIKDNEITNISNSPSELETFPSWSADGNSLYYTSALYPEKIKKPDDNIYMEYKNFKYNIYQRRFNCDSMTFSAPQLIFDASKCNKSAAFPRESPDGKFLLFSLADFGNFHIWHKSSDLYVLDLSTQCVSPLNKANSSDVESYHSWSSNGQWIVFSSRRDDGSYTRPYITWFKDGKAAKAFILPQKNPEYYQNLFKSFNIPEFMVKPVQVSRRNIINGIKPKAQPVSFKNVGNKTPDKHEKETKTMIN